MEHDELEGVGSALCVKFPTRSRIDIQCVVADVYAQLAASASITAHLIPLTLNRSRRVLSGAEIATSPGANAYAETSIPMRHRSAGRSVHATVV